MVTCPATTEQNDGDKSRKNGPGKISTLSVGQGETPGNLLTVIHKARKSLFKMFLLGGYDCASKAGTDNGDKSKLQFPCHSTFLLRYLMTCEFPLARLWAAVHVVRFPAALGTALCLFSAHPKSV